MIGMIVAGMATTRLLMKPGAEVGCRSSTPL